MHDEEENKAKRDGDLRKHLLPIQAGHSRKPPPPAFASGNLNHEYPLKIRSDANGQTRRTPANTSAFHHISSSSSAAGSRRFVPVSRSAPKIGVPSRFETPTIENASPIRSLRGAARRGVIDA